MDIGYIILIIIGALIVLTVTISYVCFRMAFYMSKKAKRKTFGDMPPGDVYDPYKEQMLLWRKEIESIDAEKVEITSFDGLKLRGKYYEHVKGAPVEIMFHGYRGYSERDLCGGLNRCIKLKKNVLAVDHRAHGDSEGHVISFGIKERYDVKAWTEYAYNRFGDNVKLIITGISMGASSVLMASSLELPKSVVGVIADCGYTSPKEIITSVIKNMGLPPKLCYPFVKLGAKLFGRFNLDQTSCVEELKKTKLPIMLIHGDKDELVPYYMSEQNKNACASWCELIKIEGAGHGTSLLVNQEKYINALKEFEKVYDK